MGQIVRFMPLCWRLQNATPRGPSALLHEHLAPLCQVVQHIPISMSDRQERQIVGPFQAKPWDQANKEHLQKELGDIMWYVANAAMALDMRLDEIIYINTLKLAARYPEGMFDAHYSENRAPGDI